jgi:hypothetical protein
VPAAVRDEMTKALVAEMKLHGHIPLKAHIDRVTVLPTLTSWIHRSDQRRDPL